MNPFAEAWELLTSGDLYVWNVILRSLQISGSAILLAALVGLPIGVAVGLSRFRFRRPLVALINACKAGEVSIPVVDWDGEVLPEEQVPWPQL